MPLTILYMSGWISQEKALNLLKKKRFPIIKTVFVKSEKNLLKEAKKLKYPVVLKLISPDIVHKSDANIIFLNIQNDEELEERYQKSIKNAKKFKKTVKIDGILLQEMISGQEVIIGMKRDEQFGPVVMFGLGGIFVEILKDVSFRIAPIERDIALEMIKETKGYKILEGVRGQKKAKIKDLVEIIRKVSLLVEKDKKIQEIDFNPVIVNNKEAKIVDFRILKK
jgi:acyl-CoA synthetase (NDP forming)